MNALWLMIAIVVLIGGPTLVYWLSTHNRALEARVREAELDSARKAGLIRSIRFETAKSADVVPEVGVIKDLIDNYDRKEGKEIE